MESIELMYFSLTEHSFLEGFEVNFSQEMAFEINDNELHISKNNGINIFDEAISNFNLIIGKNGIGKTTILNTIYSSLHGMVRNNQIFIVKKGKSINIYYSGKDIKINTELLNASFPDYNFNLVTSGFIFDVVPFSDRDENYRQEIKNIVYISDFVDSSISSSSHRYEMNHAFNYSPLSLISRPNDFFQYKNNVGGTIKSTVSNFKLIGKLNQIKFLFDSKHRFDFLLPERVGVYFYNFFNLIDSHHKRGYYKNQMQLNRWVRYMLKRLKSDKDFLGNLCDVNLLFSMNNLFDLSKYAIDEFKALNTLNLEGTEETRALFEARSIEYRKGATKVIDDFIKKVISVDELIVSYTSLLEKTGILNFYSRIDDEPISILEDLQNIIDSYKSIINHYSQFFIEQKAAFDMDLKEAAEFLSEYIVLTGNTEVKNAPSISVPNDIKYYLNDEEFYFSSGEDSIIRLFSYIDQSVKNVRDITKDKKISLMILLDEPSNGYHPEMQKGFIGKINKFLNQYEDCQFHVIMTSHSPIISSDLTRNHVIFVDNEIVNSKNRIYCIKNYEKPRTFAQNIYRLYKDSFFVGDGLIGEFADLRLSGIYNQMKFNERDFNDLTQRYSEKEISFYIDEIGEPFIKSRFELLRNKSGGDVYERVMKMENIDSDLKKELLSLIRTNGRQKK